MSEEIIENELSENELSENDEETEVVVEREIPEVDSKYRLILLAAQRSKQLQKGATPRLNMDQKKHKNTRIALEELKNRKVRYELIEDF